MPLNVLILCTHNSARSVLAEAMLNHWAERLGKDVCGHSAGSAPGGRIHPLALEVLRDAGVETARWRSKSWDEFVGPGAAPMDIVITVCDNAAAEPCPYWPGSPVRVHWGYPDPSDAPLAQRRQAFESTRQSLSDRMRRLLELPLAPLGPAELQRALQALAEPAPA
jgi:arsenate reductase